MKHRKVALGSYAKLNDRDGKPDPDMIPQHYSHTTANGQMKVDVVFGLVRAPESEDSVRDAFKEIATQLRTFADGIEKIEANAPTFSPGGST